MSYFRTQPHRARRTLGTGTTGTGGDRPPAPSLWARRSISSGFSSTNWAVVATVGGFTYPYLKWLYSSAPQVVSGTAYSDRGTTVLKGASAGLLVNGGLSGVAGAAAAVGSTGNNGLYYFLVPNGTFAVAGKQVLIYTNGTGTGAIFNEKTTASLTGSSIYGGYLKELATSATTSLTALSGDLATALGSNSAGAAALAALSNREIDITAASFAIDQTLTVTGTLILSDNSPVTQSAAIIAGNLALLGNGSYALTNPSNAIGTLAANSGAVSLTDTSSLTIGSVAGTSGVTSTGAVTLTSGGSLTLASAVVAGSTANVALSAAGNFINTAGSGAITVSGGGRWLVYSNSSAGDTFGNLNSGNTAIWNATFAGLAPASVTQNGNRYIFAFQPTLTITTTDVAKTYGDTPDISAAFSVSGFQTGVTNAYLTDAALNVYSGAPAIASAGTSASASVAGGPYAITATQGLLVSLDGYGFSFQNSGLLTVSPASLTVTANSGQSKTYGDSDPAFAYTITTGHLVGSDTLGGALARNAGENVGSYAINQGSLAASSNYTLSYVGANFAINPMALTVTATAGQSKAYGDADPTLAYTLTTGHLVGGDALTGVLTRNPGENAGSYAIHPGKPGGLQQLYPRLYRGQLHHQSHGADCDGHRGPVQNLWRCRPRQLGLCHYHWPSGGRRRADRRAVPQSR